MKRLNLYCGKRNVRSKEQKLKPFKVKETSETFYFVILSGAKYLFF